MIHQITKPKEFYHDLPRKLYICLFLIYSALVILGTADFLNNSTLQKVGIISGYYRYMYQIILLIMCLQKKATIKRIIFIICSILLLSVSIYTTRNLEILLPILIIYSYPQNLKFKHLSVYSYYVTLTLAFLIILASYIGILGNEISINDGSQSLGFTTTNTLGNVIGIAFLFRTIGKWEIWNWKYILFWLGISIYFVFYIAKSDAAFYIMIFIIIFLSLNKVRVIPEFVREIIYKLPPIVFVMNTILSIWVTIYLSHVGAGINFYNFIDKFFSHRQVYLIYYYQTYGMELWGHHIETVSYAESMLTNGRLKWMGLDNSYMYLAIGYGLIMIFSLFIIYCTCSKLVEHKKNLGAALFLIMFAMFGLTEHVMLTWSWNYALIIFASYLNNDNNKFKPKGINDGESVL